MKFQNIILLSVWSILFFGSILSLFVMSHEITHAVRFNSPEMLCIGVSDTGFGRVYHNTEMSEAHIFKEEIIANLIASIICIIYLITTFYMVVYFVQPRICQS